MNKDKIARTVIETAIDQVVSRVQSDPKRSIRTIVDLGERFSNGRFQRDTFSFVTSLLEDEESPYYAMASNLVTKTNIYAIKALGFNVGYFGWSKGAKVLRKLEGELGYNIPWAIHFYIRNKLDIPSYRQMVAQGRELGIYCYMFYFDETGIDLYPLLKFFREEEDCGFFLFLPSGWNSEYAAHFALCTNMMVLLDGGAETFQEEAARLSTLRTFHGAYHTYKTAEERDSILTSDFFQRVGQAGLAIGLTLQTAAVPLEGQQAFYDELCALREHPKEPILPIDLHEDVLRIDEIISEGPCYFGVASNGSILTLQHGILTPTGATVQDGSLKELLASHQVN